LYADVAFHRVNVMPSATGGLIFQSHRPGFTPEWYSRFKFGGQKEADEMARGVVATLAKAYPQHVFGKAQPSVASPETRLTPSAARHLNDRVLVHINRLRRQKGLQPATHLDVVAEHQGGSFGDMLRADREAFLARMQFRPHGPVAQGPIIVGDDLTSTGSSIRKMARDVREQYPDQEVLTYVGVELASGYVEQHPEVEGILNRSAVQSIDDLHELALEPGWQITSWAARLLEEAAIKENALGLVGEVVSQIQPQHRWGVMRSHPEFARRLDLSIPEVVAERPGIGLVTNLEWG
jgi:hypothetical protein